MKIKVFYSDKGDCFLISNKTAGGEIFRMLVDGGMRDSYRDHVAPSLFEELKLENGGKTKTEKLNLVYVSHIDQDHISGVLELFDSLKDWRIFDYQKKKKNPAFPKPESPRPPEVESVWHNAFREQIKDNAGRIEDLLAATAAILSTSTDAETLDLAAGFQDLSFSKSEAVQLSRRLGTKQLDVPLNLEFGGKLMCLKEDAPAPPPIPLGGMNFYVLAPMEKDLEDLREEWNKWLEKQEKQVRRIQKRAVQDEKDLIGTTNAAAAVLEMNQRKAEEMKRDLLASSESTEKAEEKRLRRRLGKRNKVTVPNLASLMVLLEDGDKKVLLTGDGHSEDILKGLKFHDKLDQDNGNNLHVNVLKVQHHGSEHNIDIEFCQKITADHYIFCGNGEHENPDLDAVTVILNSRLGGATDKSRNKEVDNHFTLWFNSSEKMTEKWSKKTSAKTHMKELAELVEDRRLKSGSRFDAKFLEDGSFFEFEV